MRSIFVALFCVLSLCLLLPAQDTRGTISGTITDSQGASVAGASVTVTKHRNRYQHTSYIKSERLL